MFTNQLYKHKTFNNEIIELVCSDKFLFRYLGNEFKDVHFRIIESELNCFWIKSPRKFYFE